MTLEMLESIRRVVQNLEESASLDPAETVEELFIMDSISQLNQALGRLIFRKIGEDLDLYQSAKRRAQSARSLIARKFHRSASP